jgi:asparagine synthase (glutamine-hydrolysing)
MCGFAGFLAPRRLPAAELARAWLGAMTGTLCHRGPDDSGAWVETQSGVGLGHRRLSIIELSPLGHQPMVSASGRLVLAFNGEIYNFRELREELEALGRSFRGHSDTEVLLEGIECWGLVATLQRCVGMFALALWNCQSRTLSLARDRLGEKPLYYGWAGDALVFGSEIKALRAFPEWKPSLDRGALALFLRYSYVPAPYSIYAGIHKLPPGGWLELSFGQAERRELPAPGRYWSFPEVVAAGAAHPFTGSEGAAADALEEALKRAVRGQMVADVPVGAFLSSGIDSATVVSLMQAQSARPVRTFTIGFHEAGFDEAAGARAIAQRLGTQHTELYVTPREAMELLPNLPAVYDEPFADSSQIPTYLVSRLARREVTVCLSGDGGDELFGGYSRYVTAALRWRQLMGVPRPLRSLLSAAMGALLSSRRRWPATAHAWEDRLNWHRLSLQAPDLQAFYRLLLSQTRIGADLLQAPDEPPTVLTTASAVPGVNHPAEWMMFWDTGSYLPDDILVKVDRAGMAVSLEGRIPMLDHRVVELAWRLPLDCKLRDGVGKRVLRQVAGRYLPPDLLSRQKRGFAVPIGAWLRGPLRAWAEDLVTPARLRREGYFCAEEVQRRWQAFLRGAPLDYEVWNVVGFQAWLASQAPARSLTCSTANS